MMKHLFTALTCLLISFSSLAVKKATASEFDQAYITHEKFVTLSEKDQLKIVAKLMEFMVSAEGKSKYMEVVKSGTPEEKAKWQKIVQLFSSLVMSEAHAQDDFKSYNANYLKAKNGKAINAQRRCVYAGWVSQTVYSKEKKGFVCSHPSTLNTGANKSNIVGYKAASDCKGTDLIACNPVVFGFESGNKLFCVKATPAMHNSSLECMQKSLGSGKEDRLKKIAANLAGNKALFNEVMEFIFFTCACSPEFSKTGKKAVVSEKYQEYMRPHRTCFALLNQMKEVLAQDACVEPYSKDESFATMKDFLAQIEKKFSEEAFSGSIDDKGTTRDISFDAEYGAEIDKIFSKDAKTAAFCRNMVGLEVKPETPPSINVGSGIGDKEPTDKDKSCKVTCTPDEEKKDLKCLIALTPEDPEAIKDTKNPLEFRAKDIEEAKAQSKYKDLVCELDDSDKKDGGPSDNKYKAEVISTIGSVKARFEIVVKKGDEIITTGMKFVWNKKASTPTPVTKKDDTKSTDDKDKKAPPVAEETVLPGATATLEVPKELASFEVCPEVKADDGGEVNKLDCQPVEALSVPTAPATATGGGPGNPVPQPRQRMQNIHMMNGVR